MKNIYCQTGIYRITNTVNGKSYIGKTGMNFGDRWDCHRAQLNGGYHCNRHLQNAWNKYGAENFEFAVIYKESDQDRLNVLEQQCIAEYRAKGLCYNISDGGDGGNNLGKHLSESTKHKIGEKNRVNMLGRKASEETKRKMSESQRNRWTDEMRVEWGKLMSEKVSGYHWCDAAKERFTIAQRQHPHGAKLTPDDIRAIRAKRASGMTTTALAKEYQTSSSNISNIVRRKRWAYID